MKTVQSIEGKQRSEGMLSFPGLVVKIVALAAIARFGPGFRDLGGKNGSHTLNSALIVAQYHPGVALCGEKGEYHTLVTDGPLFK
jgi:diphthamide synthase (EF-2-diphthine--ammonia ligase)